MENPLHGIPYKPSMHKTGMYTYTHHTHGLMGNGCWSMYRDSTRDVFATNQASATLGLSMLCQWGNFCLSKSCHTGLYIHGYTLLYYIILI